MAEKHETVERGLSQLTSRTVLLSSAAGLIIGGPLIGLMGFSFLATMTLLLVTTPLFILFSPVLFGAVCVLALAMLGFATAGAMAVAGVLMVARVLRGGAVGWFGEGAGADRRIEAGVGEKAMPGKDWVGILFHKVQTNRPEKLLTNEA